MRWLGGGGVEALRGKRGCKRGHVGPRFTSLTASTLFFSGGLLLLGGAVTAQAVSPGPDAISLQPTISYVPTPAAVPNTLGALATTLRLTVLSRGTAND